VKAAMMRALVLKDLRILRYRLLFALLVVVLALVPLSPRIPRGMLGVFFVYLMVNTYVMQLGTLEEQSRGDVLVSLLPVGRRHIVHARYLLLGALSAIVAALYVGPLATVGLFASAPPSAATLGVWWLWAAAVPLFVWSFMMPVLFTYGATRSQMALNLSVLLPALALPLLGPLLRPFFRSLTAEGVFSSLPVALGAFAGAAAMAYISSLVSVRVYGRRDL
jgi:hypothetical protein